MNSLIMLPRRVVLKLEEGREPFVYTLLTFFTAITFRNFFEILSSRARFSLQAFWHYDLSYIALALSLILVFQLFEGRGFVKTARIVLPGFLILNLVPLFDFVWSHGQGIPILYMEGPAARLFYRYLSFFGSLKQMGVTIGMRIEIGLVVIFSFIYMYQKTSLLIRSLLFSWSIYTLLFVYCAFPFWVHTFLRIFNASYQEPNIALSAFFIFLICFLGGGCFFFCERKTILPAVRPIKPFLLLGYEFMYFVGLIYGDHCSGVPLQTEIVLTALVMMLGIFFSWLFEVLNNPVHAKGARPTAFHKTLSLASASAALAAGASAGPFSFYCILMLLCSSVIYLMPPVSLWRFPVISRIPVAINTLTLILAGLVQMTVNHTELSTKSIAILMLTVTASASLSDALKLLLRKKRS